MMAEYNESIGINGGIHPKHPKTGEIIDWQVGSGPSDYQLSEVFPESLVYNRDIVRAVHQKRKWDAMCDEAKIIAIWICEIAPDDMLRSLPGYTIKRRVAGYFRKKWGRLRVRKAIRDIEIFIS